MLDFLRRGVKSWPAKVLLALLILSFAVWGISDIFVGSRNAAVAHVGETEVDSNMFARSMIRQQNLLSQRRGELVSLQELRQADIDDRMIEGLIRDAAFKEELSHLGIAIPDDAVRETIASNPSFQDSSGNFSTYAYQTLLGQQQYEPREFEQLTADQLGQQAAFQVVDVRHTLAEERVVLGQKLVGQILHHRKYGVGRGDELAINHRVEA